MVTRRVQRLVGVYHANGSVLGELTYVINRQRGKAHCELCDITHGRLRAKPGWLAAKDTLPVAIETVHLDERDLDLAAATEGSTPCVVAVTDDGVIPLLSTADLERCNKQPALLIGAIEAKVAELGLEWAAAGAAD